MFISKIDAKVLIAEFLQRQSKLTNHPSWELIPYNCQELYLCRGEHFRQILGF